MHRNISSKPSAAAIFTSSAVSYKKSLIVLKPTFISA